MSDDGELARLRAEVAWLRSLVDRLVGGVGPADARPEPAEEGPSRPVDGSGPTRPSVRRTNRVYPPEHGTAAVQQTRPVDPDEHARREAEHAARTPPAGPRRARRIDQTATDEPAP